MTDLQQGRWVLLGLVILLALLLIAWQVAVTIGEKTQQLAPHPATVVSRIDGEGSDVQITGGQLVTEIPERKEKWVLHFATSHYETDKQLVMAKEGICQVTRSGRLITVFRAPTIVVRFENREMEMRGGVTVIAMLPRLKVQLRALKWNWETGQLVGVGVVKIEGERINGVADGLRGDTTLQQISLIGRIHLNWRTKNGEKK